MIKRSIEFDESFFEDFDPKKTEELRFFLKEVDIKFRTEIIELEKIPNTDPFLLGLVMKNKINTVSEQIVRPDFSDIGMSTADLNNFMEYIAQEALSDYFRQFQNDDEQILKAMRIINKM